VAHGNLVQVKHSGLGNFQNKKAWKFVTGSNPGQGWNIRNALCKPIPNLGGMLLGQQGVSKAPVIVLWGSIPLPPAFKSFWLNDLGRKSEKSVHIANSGVCIGRGETVVSPFTNSFEGCANERF